MNRRTIVKIGGSCFQQPQLLRRITATLDEQSTRQSRIFICGGGHFAEAVRRQYAVHSLPDDVCHHLAIEAMTMQSKVFAHLSGMPLIAEPPSSGDAILDVVEWLNSHTNIEGLIPQTWEVTSDSLAAYVARYYESPLMLIKSCDLPEGGLNVTRLAQLGIVDAHFPVACVSLKSVKLVKLKDG